MLPRTYPDSIPCPDKLVAAHYDLARKIAWHVHGRVGKRVEIDDLLQVAYLGLLDAARRYEVKPDTPFAAYAGIRIRGAVTDYLRGLAGMTRSALRMQSRLRHAEQRLEQSLMRQPTEVELAETLQISADELARWRIEIDNAAVSSIEDIYTDHSILFRDSGIDIEERLTRNTRKRMVADAIKKLPEREALLLQLYYVEELNVYEIAEILGVTTGRVSQIKKAAINRLGQFIGAQAGPD
ncbi:MAG: sigma-70 family RNA polymerase sigma factor [Roseinatronobacter sp.]